MSLTSLIDEGTLKLMKFKESLLKIQIKKYNQKEYEKKVTKIYTKILYNK